MQKKTKPLPETKPNLEENEVFYKHLVELTPDAIVIHSEGKIIYANPTAVKLIKAKKENEVIGRSIIDFIHPDSLSLIQERIKKMLSTKKVAPFVEEKFITLTGEIIYAETKAVPFIYKGKQAILAILHDITSKKKVENELAHLASLVESSSDAIWSRSLDKKILSWNKGAEQMYGFTAKEAIGKNLAKFTVPHDKKEEFEEIIQKILRGEQIKSLETSRLTKEGRTIDVSMTLSPLRDAHKKIVGISAIVRNITEQKEQEKLKDEFISMASHELKTPVTSLKMFLDILERSLPNADQSEMLMYVNRIKDQANKIKDLVSDLLDISRIGAGKLSFNLEKFMLEDLIKDTIEGIQPAAKKHKLLFKDASPLQVNADKFRIYQVVTNLVNNAIKYSPKGDKVIITTSKNKRRVIVSVRDFGIGIAKDKQKKIFEKLYQVTDPQVKTFPGLGMGLYISNEIIKRHNGEMWVKSTKGKGSTFYFSLPLMQK